MKAKKYQHYYVVRLEKNEEIISSLNKIAEEKKISGAFFFGLGVGKKLVLGYFDARKKSYIKKLFEGEYEFVSLSGNISRFSKETVIHAHAAITDKNFNAFGGHLFHGVVPATLELIILPTGERLNRKKDRKTGLNLLDL